MAERLTMKLMLIDLSSIFWMNWHATHGDGSTAFERTLGRVRALSSDAAYTGIAIDTGKSFRADIYPEYKATRPDKEPAAREQYRRTHEALAKEGFHVFGAESFEADDVLATLSMWAQERDEVDEVIIASADKDLLQCATGKTWILNVTKNELRSPEWVFETLGCLPDKVPVWLGLVGDTADNVPGVPGVGPKRATEYLRQFKTVDGIIKAAFDGDISGKTAESIVTNEATLSQSVLLCTLRTDVPINCDDILTRKEIAPVSEEAPQEAEIFEPEPVDAKPEPEAEPEPKAAPVVALEPVSFEKQLEPRNMTQAWGLAKTLIASRFFKGVNSTEQSLAVIMAGREMGIGAMTSLRSFHIIQGKICPSAQLLAGLVLRSGLADYFEPILSECDEKSATWVTRRKGSKREQKVSFTIDDARQAGLVSKSDSNWSKHPKIMLRWRACAELARAVYPDVVGNLYVPEDFDE